MKNVVLGLITLVLAYSCSNGAETEKNKTPMQKEVTKQLRHVVLFKFKDSATADAIKKVEDAFTELPSKIEEIQDFEWGLNNSPEELNKGFTHCFFVTFNSEEERAIYLPHPAHKSFVNVLSPQLEDVLVLDYWTQ